MHLDIGAAVITCSLRLGPGGIWADACIARRVVYAFQKVEHGNCGVTTKNGLSRTLNGRIKVFAALSAAYDPSRAEVMNSTWDLNVTTPSLRTSPWERRESFQDALRRHSALDDSLQLQLHRKISHSAKQETSLVQPPGNDCHGSARWSEHSAKWWVRLVDEMPQEMRMSEGDECRGDADGENPLEAEVPKTRSNP